MKKIIHIIVSLLIVFLAIPKVGAVDIRVKNLYDTFLGKIENNYTLEKQSEILQTVQNIAQELQEKETNTAKQAFIEDLLQVNNEAMYTVWTQKEFDQSPQKSQELLIRLNLQKQLSGIQASSTAQQIINAGGGEYKALNSEREFVEGREIYRVKYTSFFQVNSQNISSLKKKQGIIIQESGEERFIEDYSFEKKIPYSELASSFAGFFTPDYKLVDKNNNYYTHNFVNFHFFNDTYGAYQDQLDASGFKKESTFVYRDKDRRYNFVTNYESHGVIAKTSVFGVPEKEVFLDALREDSKYPTVNIGNYLSQIQAITETITQGKTKQEKIETIYDWILNNISYSTNISLSDEKIFSAIETFKNKDGVCTGYTKLMLYMLLYAGIYDVEVIRGHVIDAADFPQIGHAWVRIGDKYYDPTFDDPIGLKIAKKKEEYKYFGLPKDIFYANRFEYEELPDSFETASKTQISQYIFNYLSKLLVKYEGKTQDYKIFAPIEFYVKHNISNTTLLTPELIAQKLGSFSVANNTFSFIENGNRRRISNIRYYVLNSENTQKILESLNYDIENFYIFDWEISPGQHEWRLAYELEVQ